MAYRQKLAFACLSLWAAVLGGCATSSTAPREYVQASPTATVAPVVERKVSAEPADVRPAILPVSNQPIPSPPPPTLRAESPIAAPTATTYSADYVNNLRACLAGTYGCRREILAADDLTKVSVVDQERNFSACLSGYANCHPANLTAEQQLRVTTAANDRNLRACLAGYSSCQQGSLTAEQRGATEARARERNLSACLQGYSSCREDILSQEEKVSVGTRRAERNLSACLAGYSSCRPAELSTDQQSKVASIARERNFSKCLVFSPTCNTQDLTPDEIEKVQKKRDELAAHSPPQPTTIPTYVPGGPGCAENGSCYGDVSAITGMPKTIAVSGYYRRDGTYVRGHYRSRR